MSRPASLRLDRLLANLGYGSRREVQDLIAAGRVRMDGLVLGDPSGKLALGVDLAGRVVVGGRPLDPPPPLHLVMHKPFGLVCSHREEGRSIYELLPPRWRRRTPMLSAVGRLDIDTSGLLLITDDGEFLHRVISPKAHVRKRYHVTLARPLAGDEAERILAGTLVLAGEAAPLAAGRLEPLSEITAWLTIREGRYHQVRRMFAALGNHVTALHRDRVGALDLPADLPAGSYRILEEAEREALFQP